MSISSFNKHRIQSPYSKKATVTIERPPNYYLFGRGVRFEADPLASSIIDNLFTLTEITEAQAVEPERLPWPSEMSTADLADKAEWLGRAIASADFTVDVIDIDGLIRDPDYLEKHIANAHLVGIDRIIVAEGEAAEYNPNLSEHLIRGIAAEFPMQPIIRVGNAAIGLYVERRESATPEESLQLVSQIAA